MTSADPLFKGPFEILERVAGGYNIAHKGMTIVANITPVPPEQLALNEEQLRNKQTKSV